MVSDHFIEVIKVSCIEPVMQGVRGGVITADIQRLTQFFTQLLILMVAEGLESTVLKGIILQEHPTDIVVVAIPFLNCVLCVSHFLYLKL